MCSVTLARRGFISKKTPSLLVIDLKGGATGVEKWVEEFSASVDSVCGRRAEG